MENKTTQEQKTEKKIYERWWFWTIIIIFILILILAGIIIKGQQKIAEINDLQPKKIAGIYNPLIILSTYDINRETKINEESISNPSWFYEKDDSNNLFLKTDFKEFELPINNKDYYIVRALNGNKVAVINEKEKEVVFIDLTAKTITKFKGDMVITYRNYIDNFPGLATLDGNKVFISNSEFIGNLVDFKNNTVFVIEKKEFLKEPWESINFNFSMRNYANIISAVYGEGLATLPNSQTKFFSPNHKFYYTLEKIESGICIDTCGLSYKIAIFTSDNKKVGEYHDHDWFIPFSWDKDSKKLYLAAFFNLKEERSVNNKEKIIKEIDITNLYQ